MCKLLQLSGTSITGHYYYGIAEVHQSAVSVSQSAFVQHLQQHIENVAVCLFYLVEQHDRVGLPSYSLSQLSAFLVAHISWRGTYES